MTSEAEEIMFQFTKEQAEYLLKHHRESGSETGPSIGSQDATRDVRSNLGRSQGDASILERALREIASYDGDYRVTPLMDSMINSAKQALEEYSSIDTASG